MFVLYMMSCALNSKTKRCRKSGHGDSRCYMGPKNRCRLVRTKKGTKKKSNASTKSKSKSKSTSSSSSSSNTKTNRRVYKPTKENAEGIITTAVDWHNATPEEEVKIRKFVTNFQTTKRKHIGNFARYDLQEKNGLDYYLLDQISGWYKYAGGMGDI